MQTSHIHCVSQKNIPLAFLFCASMSLSLSAVSMGLAAWIKMNDISAKCSKVTVKIGTNIHLLTDFKPEWLLSMNIYIFFVNKKEIKVVGELRQRIVEEWKQLGQHVIDNVIRQWHRRLRGCVNADGGQFEHSLWLTFRLPQWTSLSFLKCSIILYRLHCYMFSIVFASADYIVRCKEYLLYIPQSPTSVESTFSSEHLVQILRKLAHYYANYSQK